MLITVDEFCDFVSESLNDLIDELASITGRSTASEREAWQRSLPKLSTVFANATKSNPALGRAHLNLGHLSLEYKLPGASAWCDALILGKDSEGNPRVVIIELKDWDLTGDQPGQYEGLITHHGQQRLHPSDQAKGYTQYCQRFHSAVLQHQATVDGCVFFTGKGDLTPYLQSPNDQLAVEYPLFDVSDAGNLLGSFLTERIIDSDENFAEDFKSGVYQQDRNILRQVAAAMADNPDSPFELLDEQRKGFNLVMSAIESHKATSAEKKVIIVHGPPGSGKSALAANTWVKAAQKFNDQGNIVFVTTSSSQKANWQQTFETASSDRNAKGMVLPSNQFNPGLSGYKVSKLRKETGNAMEYENWHECLEIFHGHYPEVNCSPDNLHFLSIVDEAHALINPDGHPIGFASGWCVQAGPQAYHIIRSSQISVFLLDSEQSYRDSETTSIQDLERFATEFHAEVEHVDLSDQQFRCGGSKEYELWVDSLLDSSTPDKIDVSWRITSNNPNGAFGFQLVDSLHRLDETLNAHHANGHSVRLLSSYSRKWVTKKESNIHHLPPEHQDFFFQYEDDFGNQKTWSRPWNYAPNEDYSMYIQATPGSMMAANPLAEVGCPYVVRGFEYDYLGILWLDDLVRRNGQWTLLLDNVHETALKVSGKAARQKLRKRGSPEAIQAQIDSIAEGKLKLLSRVARGYRILLTRAVKGVYVYAHDDETRDYLKEVLNGRV